MKEELWENFITSIIMDTKLMNIAAKNTNYSIQVGWLMKY
jgi:hypothetical protein